jgi:hypothetical protein
VARQLAARGARMVVAEWPDEPPFVAAAARLRELGWSEEGRIAEFTAPGVDLVILRQR